MIITSIDVTIPFSRRHANETIRNIIRYDSGYLKDLFLKDERVVFSETCLLDIQRLTKGHKDNWENPVNATDSIFDSLKKYSSPYLFDFNDEKINEINAQRLNRRSTDKVY